MKRTALLALIFATAAFPVPAKSHHARPHHAYRHSNHTAARSHVTCEMVRTYVAEMGLAQARAMADAAGMTAAEERKARRCLGKSVYRAPFGSVST